MQTLGESLLHFRRPEDQNNFLQPHAMENFAYNAWEQVGWSHFSDILQDCTKGNLLEKLFKRICC